MSTRKEIVSSFYGQYDEEFKALTKWYMAFSEKRELLGTTKLATPISNGGLLLNRSAVLVPIPPKAGFAIPFSTCGPRWGLWAYPSILSFSSCSLM